MIDSQSDPSKIFIAMVLTILFIFNGEVRVKNVLSLQLHIDGDAT